MLADPILESSGARQPTEESIAAASGLGGSEQSAPTVDGSTTMPKATVETAWSSVANAGDASAMPESRAAKPVVLEEQLVPPKASQSMVGLAVRPWSPLVVPLAVVEEDEVEEIEREES